ncbi:hypothetical protein FRX94_11945 [Corynebacterium canis]|uniref:Uncharacterized protein n=2 Tax=Corynebacterium canis TaxID=679663 RepID=A0A5C5TY24_9CORY|nr:hypothetical protein FRX94_11945 [Corynebacterium canis]WJY75096.1 hypothetical protein CCANI_06270 [Corynebacterium canis]
MKSQIDKTRWNLFDLYVNSMARRKVATLPEMISEQECYSDALKKSNERPRLNFPHQAPYVTFNSTTDNPEWGDEFQFLRIREVHDDGVTEPRNEITVQPGELYLATLYYNNNAEADQLARNTQIKVTVPSVIRAHQTAELIGEIYAQNARPNCYFSSVKLTANEDIIFRYISTDEYPLNTIVRSEGRINHHILGTEIFEGTMRKVGYYEADGLVPGGIEYAGMVHMVFEAQSAQANYEIEVHSKTKNDTEWRSGNFVSVGEEISFLVSYQNTGTVQQDNVVFKVALPFGFEYVPGSSRLANSKHPTGSAAPDGITTSGINIGSYAPRGNANMKFNVKVVSNQASEESDDLEIAKLYFTTITENGNKQVISCIYTED